MIASLLSAVGCLAGSIAVLLKQRGPVAAPTVLAYACFVDRGMSAPTERGQLPGRLVTGHP